MKKLFLLVALLAVSSFAGVQDFYTDWGTASGKAISTSTSDSQYFKINDPLSDSVIVFYEQYSALSNPSVTLKLLSTVDPIGSMGDDAVSVLARRAVWSAVSTLVSSLTTESSVLYYGVAHSDLAAAPGRYYMLQATSGAASAHQSDSYILKSGVITLKVPD